MSCLATKIIRRHAMSFISASNKYECTRICRHLNPITFTSNTWFKQHQIKYYFQSSHKHTHTKLIILRCFKKNHNPVCSPYVLQQEMQDNVKKCKNFLATLIKLASHNSPSPETSKNVKSLVQDLLVRITQRIKNNSDIETSLQ